MPTRHLLRAAVLLSFLSYLGPGLLLGQSPPSPRLVCWRPAPKPSCRLIALTSFGLYFLAGSELNSRLDPLGGGIVEQSRLTVGGRFAGDWGFLYNVDRRDAFGLSVLGSIDNASYGNGAELAGFVRYRRWLGRERNLDVALGMPLIPRNADALGAPYGLVKFNFTGQLGIAFRPEVRRTYVFTDRPRKKSRLFLSAGVEIGERPGFVVSAIGAALLGVLTIMVLQYAD